LGAELAGYRVEWLLGRGGMSVVYLAEDLRLGRKVALKLLAPELAEDERFRERFLRESRLAASIDHPNVIPIYEAGEAESVLFIAMRYVDGTDLKRLLAQEGSLEPARALAFLAQAANALDEAHEHGLVHRDVKPGNILIGAHEHVYLSDFGLTKQTGSESGITETGQFMGTADYVSPEQIERGTIDARSDLYALGCVLYECLAGEAPYRSEALMHVLWAHVHAPAPSLREHRPELPETIDTVIAKGMAKNPDDRYDSCRKLIEEARGALGITGELPVPTVGTQAITRRRLLVAAGGALVVAAGVAVPAVLLTRGGGEEAAKPLVIEPGSLVRVDPTTNEPVAAIHLEGLRDVYSVAVGEGAVWGTSLVNGTVYRVDPKTVTVTKTVSIRGGPRDLTVGEGAVWVASSSQGEGRLTEIDPPTGRVRRDFSLGYSDPVALAAGQGAVWVAANDVRRGSAVLRILPATGEVVATIPLPDKLRSIGAGEGAVWVASEGSNVFGGRVESAVWRIDPERNEVVATIEVTDPVGLAVGEGAVWIAESGPGSVTRIDPATNRVASEIEIGANLGGIAAGEGSVWVTDYDAAVIARIDAKTNRVVAKSTLVPPRPDFPAQVGPGDVAVGSEGVWVGIFG
jgi:streptogramin lyase/predicted Ser/Thr protein kinase